MAGVERRPSSSERAGEHEVGDAGGNSGEESMTRVIRGSRAAFGSRRAEPSWRDAHRRSGGELSQGEGVVGGSREA